MANLETHLRQRPAKVTTIDTELLPDRYQIDAAPVQLTGLGEFLR